MVELDAAQVLSIPRKIKSQEVVRRGFMSNFLFQNISNIFGAPTIVQKIVEKLAPAQEDSGKRQPMEKSRIFPWGKMVRLIFQKKSLLVRRETCSAKNL